MYGAGIYIGQVDGAFERYIGNLPNPPARDDWWNRNRRYEALELVAGIGAMAAQRRYANVKAHITEKFIPLVGSDLTFMGASPPAIGYYRRHPPPPPPSVNIAETAAGLTRRVEGAWLRRMAEGPIIDVSPDRNSPVLLLEAPESPTGGPRSKAGGFQQG